MSGERCILCDSPGSTFLFQIPDFWLERNDVISRFVRCDGCGLVYQSPQPAKDQWHRLYPEDYSVYQPAQSSWLQTYGLQKRAQVLLEQVSKGHLLDVGCGNGAFMKYLKDAHGWQVTGIEPNQAVAARLNAEGKLRVFSKPLEEASFLAETFDAVTLWDVLEHLPDPAASLRECRRILSPGGVLVLRLPDYEAVDARLFGEYWAGLDAPRHFYVFGNANLARLLEQTGFSVLKRRTDIGGYLNFVKSVQFWMTGKGVHPRVRKYLLAFLRSLPLRLAAEPLIWLKDRGNRGSEMVVVARRAE